MTSDTSQHYPAEYYYPEFLDSRPDDPLKSPPSRLKITQAIDNGIGSSTKVSRSPDKLDETTVKQTSAKSNKPLSTAGFDVVVDHGLPDAGITQALKADPKKSLLRDPAARNIPRLMVDDSIIQQTIRAPKIVTTNIDNDAERTKRLNQINQGKQTPALSHANGDLKSKFKTPEPVQQYPITYIDNQKPVIDDYWKKEVVIDNQGGVSIEPIKYDRESYEGPFGLTRQGAYAYYLILGILTLLSGIFLIMTGIFYAQNYPTGSSKTGLLTGLCICGFAFYAGLQLILIGIWHQKYRREHPVQSQAKLNQQNDSRTRLKSAMEANEQYNYSYQPPNADYQPYDYYQPPPYVSNVSEQMLLQQPGAATGAYYYDPVVWPSNVEFEHQPDPKFYQPMESLYGKQESSRIPITPARTSIALPASKPTKKDKQDYTKKPVEVKPPKSKFDNLFPNSIVTEQQLPALSKAPETNDLIRSIAQQENAIQNGPPKRTSTKRSSNRIRPIDRRNAGSPEHGSDDYNRKSHHRRQRRRHSYSSCSTCSSSSYDEHKKKGHRSPRNHQHQTSEPSFINFPAELPISSPTNPQRSHKKRNNDTSYTSTNERKKHDNRTTTHDLEDIPNVLDKDSKPNPIVHRTVIVDPYATQPNSKTVANPRTDKTEKIKKKITETNYTRMPDMHLVTIDEGAKIYDNSNEKSKKNKT